MITMIKNTACTFFGHSDFCRVDASALAEAVEKLIVKGIDIFYVGNQGYFDGMVLNILTNLHKKHRHILYSVVLAYHPTQTPNLDLYHGHIIYPDSLESCPRKFAIEKRNRWMIENSDYCICYIDRTWGGAYKFAKQSKRKGLTVINLGNFEF